MQRTETHRPVLMGRAGARDGGRDPMCRGHRGARPADPDSSSAGPWCWVADGYQRTPGASRYATRRSAG